MPAPPIGFSLTLANPPGDRVALNDIQLQKLELQSGDSGTCSNGGNKLSKCRKATVRKP